MGAADEAAKDPATTKADGPRGTPAARKGDRPSARPGGPHSLIGTMLSGRYRIEKLLGEGGMGAVYQAEHTHMKKRLAVKVLHPEMSRLSEVVARFEREAMAAAHIDHPNVAAATDFGKLEDGSFFLALEFVEGKSLRDAIGKGRLDLGRALHITYQVAAGLHRAHTLGIVHRDLKPENVMLVQRDGDPDFVKVLDFGIAKVPVGEIGTSVKAEPGQQVLTQLGMVYGTPEYMAPEQALGQPVDARADLYALGVIAYEMLTGVRPFDHESKVTLLGMQVTAPVPRMSEKSKDARVPPEVEAIIGRLLAKESTHRQSDAKELMDEIAAISNGLVAQGILTGSPVPIPTTMPRASAASHHAFGLPTGANGPLSSSALGSGPGSMRVPTTGEAPALSLARPSAGLKKIIAMAGLGVAALTVIVIIAVVVASAMKSDPKVVDPSGSNSANISSTGAPPNTGTGRESPTVMPDLFPTDTPMSVEAAMAVAKAEIDKGNYASAIDTLSKVEKANSGRADLQKLLWKAYASTKNPVEAMKHAELWIKADPEAKQDKDLQIDVRNTALLKEGSDQAFALLESKMGHVGVDIIYDIAYLTSGAQYPQAASRARASLAKAEVKDNASANLRILLDFRGAKSCDQRVALLPRAKEEGDARLLPHLKQYTATRGCGFLGRNDCHGCMHRDQSLYQAIQAIEARTKKKG